MFFVLFSIKIFFIEKCLTFVTGPEIAENKTIEQVVENVNATIDDMCK